MIKYHWPVVQYIISWLDWKHYTTRRLGTINVTVELPIKPIKQFFLTLVTMRKKACALFVAVTSAFLNTPKPNNFAENIFKCILMNFLAFRFQFLCGWFLWSYLQFTINQHWFSLWLCAEYPTSQSLNQWRLNSLTHEWCTGFQLANSEHTAQIN